MNGVDPRVFGAAVGLLAGIGLFLVLVSGPWGRRPDPAARIDPYLRRARGNELLIPPATRSARLDVLRTVLGPVTTSMLGLLERLTGGAEQLERRLRLAGRREGAESFRLEQLLMGIGGCVVGLLVALVVVASRGANPVLGLLIVLLGGALGIIGRDHLLQRTIARRGARMAREFPIVADLLALAVAAGESPVAAMERVARSSRGALPDELAATVAEIRAGATVSAALLALGERTPLTSLARFGEGVAVAIERGTPLAEVLRAQAQDAREASTRDLMELAGKREVLMMVPVVFCVLPLVIVIAIFPGVAVLEVAL